MQVFLISLPFIFLRFWFLEMPKSIIAFYGSLNHSFLQLFSLPLVLKTYFRPWKNEYREGLIGFSIGMGMFVKTWVILVDLLLLVLLLAGEVISIFLLLLLPLISIYVLFIK